MFATCVHSLPWPALNQDNGTSRVATCVHSLPWPALNQDHGTSLVCHVCSQLAVASIEPGPRHVSCWQRVFTAFRGQYRTRTTTRLMFATCVHRFPWPALSQDHSTSRVCHVCSQLPMANIESGPRHVSCLPRVRTACRGQH